jgi:hypothetical protein
MSNRVLNPGLENGDDGSWSFFSGCTLPGGNIISEPANARTGSYRLMVRGGKSGPGTQTCGEWTQVIPGGGKKKFIVDAFYKVPTLNPAVNGDFIIRGVQSGLAYLDFVISAAQPTYKEIGPTEINLDMHGDTDFLLKCVARQALTNPGFFNFYFDDFSVEEIIEIGLGQADPTSLAGRATDSAPSAVAASGARADGVIIVPSSLAPQAKPETF